jgi:hypothetical protein
MIPSLIRTPVSAAIAIVHWLVVAYSVLGDHAEGFGQSTVLQYYLLILNSPAILLTNLIVRPVIYVLGPSEGVGVFYVVVALVVITLQWLVLGGLLQKFLNEVRSESLTFRVRSDQPEKPHQSI